MMEQRRVGVKGARHILLEAGYGNALLNRPCPGGGSPVTLGERLLQLRGKSASRSAVAKSCGRTSEWLRLLDADERLPDAADTDLLAKHYGVTAEESDRWQWACVSARRSGRPPAVLDEAAPPASSAARRVRARVRGALPARYVGQTSSAREERLWRVLEDLAAAERERGRAERIRAEAERRRATTNERLASALIPSAPGDSVSPQSRPQGGGSPRSPMPPDETAATREPLAAGDTRGGRPSGVGRAARVAGTRGAR